MSLSHTWTIPPVFLVSTEPPAAEGEAGGGGGGQQAAASAPQGEPNPEDFLGDPGKRALDKLRAENDALRRQAQQFRDLDPEKFNEAQRRAEELEQRLRERERMTEAEKLRLEQKHNEALSQIKAEADQERQRRVALETRTAAKVAFEAAKGRRGADEAGLTYFDAFMATVGDRHLRVDEATGKLYVVDDQGDPLADPEGKGRLDPVAWMNKQADGSLVIGTFFEGELGEGSGMPSSRGHRGRRQADIHSMSKAQLRDFAFGVQDA